MDITNKIIEFKKDALLQINNDNEVYNSIYMLGQFELLLRMLKLIEKLESKKKGTRFYFSKYNLYAIMKKIKNEIFSEELSDLVQNYLCDVGYNE